MVVCNMTKAFTVNKHLLSYLIASGLVVFSFLLFGCSLGRYPGFFCDEPMFNYPAVRYLDSGSMAWRLNPAMPHGDEISAWHSPFYSRLQVLTFKLLGVSEYACRVPQHLAIHIALLVLCVFLIRRGFWKSAILLPMIWIGDRASQETLFGRMEGITALCVVGAFLCGLIAIEKEQVRWYAGYSCCLGLAGGFHPGSIYIALPSLCVVLILRRKIAWHRLLLGFACGAVVPLCLWLLCWMPHIPESIEQFHWYVHTLNERDISRGHFALFPMLKWSKWWVVALILTTAFWLIPRLVSLLRSIRCELSAAPFQNIIIVFATSFGCGFVLLLWRNTFIYPYYLVSFTIWPVIAVLITLESGKLNGLWKRSFTFFIILLIAGWLPSLMWNGMRFREMVLMYRQLDQKPFAQKLAKIIPADAKISGTPELFLIARTAHRDFVPLMELGEDLSPPRDHWLFLVEKDFQPGRLSKEAFNERPLVYEGFAFPEAQWAGSRMPFRVYGPANSEQRTDH